MTEIFTPVYMGKPNSFEELDENDVHQMRLKALLENVLEKPLNHGKILRFRFPNDYGASVVTHAFSLGKIDQWELAVIYYTTGLPDQDGDFVIAYDTPVTDCTVGYLAWNDVEKLLGDIQSFPPRSEPPPKRSEFVRRSVEELKKYDTPPDNVLPFKPKEEKQDGTD